MEVTSVAGQCLEVTDFLMNLCQTMLSAEEKTWAAVCSWLSHDLPKDALRF